MKSYITHVAIAAGSAIASFLVVVPTLTTDQWYQAAASVGLVFLGGLGIRVAYKTTPS